jgi:O-antigen/teichoic acid export membrane protein
LIIEGVAIFGFGLVIMPLMVSEMGVLGAVQSFVICSYIVFFISTLLFYKIFGKSLYFANTDNIGESKKYIQIGYSFLIITIISFLMSKGTVLLIGLIIHDKGDIGLYAIAERISVMISFGLMAVNAVVAPKFSAFYSNNEFEQLKKLARQTSFLFLSAAILGITIICFFSELILSVFGTEFITASSILIVLSVGQVVNLATGSVGILLSMCGYEKILRNIVLSVSISTVLLLLFLVPIYGTLGAAIAISTGLIAQNIIALFIVKQKLGFWVLPKI